MTRHEATHDYQITIGIECHVQLRTATKLFSGASNDARAMAPNTTVSPICLGFPGALPVLNDAALRLAVQAGLALNATIPEVSRFERKHYFYPDLPKGYQITQLAEPVIIGGYVDAPQPGGETKRVRIHHAHLEEDAGKLTHPVGGTESLVDFNRAGTPLIEIVSEADIHSPAEARAYAQELYRLMTYAGVTHGDLYHGNMRFDVNISLAPHGSQTLGNRAEVKNLNSFRAVEKAAEFEARRQAELLTAGRMVVQETRGWNEDTQKTVSQRSKEDAHDYRYFPDADIPPVRLTQSFVDSVKSTMPVLPDAYRRSWASLGLDDAIITTLLASQDTARIVAAVQTAAGDEHAVRVAHWFSSAATDIDIIDSDGDELAATAAHLSELSTMVQHDRLSSTSAKRVFVEVLETGQAPQRIAADKNLLQVSDEGAIVAVVDAVLADSTSAQAIADIRAGHEKALGYLVGQVMKRSGGKANPTMATTILKRRLAE